MANMAFQGHPDRPETTKVECSATHSEGPPVSADNVQEQEQEQYATRKIDIRTVLGILALAVTYESCLFSFVLPVSVLLNINQDIGPSSNIAWMATAWSLSSAVVMTIAGRCSDIFGRRNFFLTGNALGVIGCAISCRATNVSILILGSTFIGLSGGLQQLSFAAASEIVPKKYRGQTLAIMTLVSLPGSAFGAPIAYSIITVADWRWTYYIALIVNAVGFVLILICYWPPSFLGLHPEGKSRRQQFAELDFIGMLLIAGGLTVFLIGIGFGGNPYSWTSPTVLCPIILGGLCVFVAFPLWEVYCPADIAKICPPHLFQNVRTVVIPYGVTFVAGMALISMGTLWPQQIARLFTTNPTTVGWYALANQGCATVGFVVSGQTFGTLRRTRWQFIFVVTMMALFLGLNSTVNQHTPARAIAFICVASAMVGATNCIATLIVQLGANDQDIGLATGLLNSIRGVGGGTGVAIYSSLLNNRIASTWAADVGDAVVQAGLPTSSVSSFLEALQTANTTSLQEVEPNILMVGLDAEKTVFVGAFRMVYLVTIAFGALAVIGALFVGSVDNKLTRQVNVQLDRPHLVGQRDVEVEAAVVEKGQ